MPSLPADIPDPLHALRRLQEHLEARLASGQERLRLTPEARQALREIVKMKPGTRPLPVARPPRVAPEPAPVPAAKAVPDNPVFPPTDTAAPADRAARLAEVRKRAEAGERARALGSLRETMVFAAGSPDARLMLVGEAPGADEERSGEPFTGPAGRKLDQILQAMGLSRADVYISNLCKFRPAIPNQGTGNRKPTAEEMAACLEFVREEIAIVQPEAIVALGGTAAEGLLGRQESIARLRGRWHEFAGIPLLVTYHPSWLLRQSSPDEAMRARRLVWEDMLLAMDRLQMPVSEKQRRYFQS